MKSRKSKGKKKTTGDGRVVKALLAARQASYTMANLSTEKKNRALEKFARLIDQNRQKLLAANDKDMKASDPKSPLHNRLKLDSSKIDFLIAGIQDVIRLADPAGRVLDKMLLDEGLELERRSVPIGVLGIIFESRPDVIPQILSLVLKSGNACVLKGGREAAHTNAAFIALARELEVDLVKGWAQLLESREDVRVMLSRSDLLDLIIPRGGNSLVQMVMNSTKIPVLGHADGVCHLYVHERANLSMAEKLALDGKCQYPAACNSIETLLVDKAVAEEFLNHFGVVAPDCGIKLKGCPSTRKILPKIERATEEDWRTEYGDKTLSIRVVDGIEKAIEHINKYGSHHTDTIVTADTDSGEKFLNEVDSASVMVNASPRFADGFRFGLGAEVGISTSKLHARGPVGLEGLVIYKWRLIGRGHLVADYVGKSARKFLHKPLK